MQKVLKKGRAIVQKSYFPFICLAFLMLLFHLCVNPNFGDDILFKDQLTKYNLFTYLRMRWNTWTSRMVIEALEVTIIHTPFLWKIIDTGAIILLVFSISQLTGCYNNRSANWILCFTFLLYPFTTEMSNAGWCSTTLNYLWPGAACVFTIYVCSQSLIHKPKLALCIASYFTTALAISSEQFCIILFMLGLIINVYTLSHKKFNLFIFSHFLLAIFGLLLVLICPGNSNRSVQEVANWYPSYFMLNNIDKAFIGVQNTVNYIFRYGSILFAVLCLLIVIRSHIKGKLSFMDFIAGFPFVLSVVGIVISIREGWFSRQISLQKFQFSSDSGLVSIKCYLPIFLGLLSFLFIMISLYNIYGNSMNTIICIFAFGAGLATSFMLGFSPTIYASSLRIFFPLNLSMIFLISFLFNDHEISLSDKKTAKLLSALVVFLLYLYINSAP